MIAVFADPSFPTRVRVGYRTYQIEQWTRAQGADAHRYGECSHSLCSIRIDTSFGPVQSAETLTHEILHAISHTGHDDLFGTEERAVCGLAAGWTQVMRDNPQLREWFAWAWAQDD